MEAYDTLGKFLGAVRSKALRRAAGLGREHWEDCKNFPDHKIGHFEDVLDDR